MGLEAQKGLLGASLQTPRSPAATQGAQDPGLRLGCALHARSLRRARAAPAGYRGRGGLKRAPRGHASVPWWQRVSRGTLASRYGAPGPAVSTISVQTSGSLHPRGSPIPAPVCAAGAAGVREEGATGPP